MTQLIACLSTGKGTWGHVSRVIDEQDWDNIFLITNSFGKENFNLKKQGEFIEVDTNKSINELRDDIMGSLKDKIKGEIAVNLISGTGKEHMAIISALLKLGAAIRFVALTKDGMVEV